MARRLHDFAGSATPFAGIARCVRYDFLVAVSTEQCLGDKPN